MAAVLFDMDGVIVDSEDYWVTYQREEILPRAVPDRDVDVAEISGRSYRDIYSYLDETYGVEMSLETFVDVFEETAREIYGEHVTLLDGLPALLDELQAADVPVALVSSSPHDWIDVVLDRFDLRHQFDEVVSGDEFDGPGKPAPDVFEHAAGRIGVPPADCITVEDSEHGVRSAADAGTTVVAYRIDAHDGVDLSAADVVVDTPQKLRESVLEHAA
ncbi:HAD family phosphatase [Halobacteria archaeon AArc-dxtr1]|nr:HAD family phosphatase [Halobacteria archaeon AArc-dxtr1]